MKIRFGLAITVLCLAGGIMYSCTPLKKTANIISGRPMFGKWTITSVKLDDTLSAFKRLPILEDITAGCLEGSSWTLAKDDIGAYQIMGSSKNGSEKCNPGVRNIIWLLLEINKTNFIQFRRSTTQVPGVKLDKFTSYIMEIEKFEKKKILVTKYPLYYKGQTTWMHLTYTYAQN